MGPASICVACASKTLEAIAPEACPVCSQRLENDSPCRNSLCRERNRRVERIDAIAYHSGALQDKIHSYKYEGKTGWSLIFGRLLVGWLEAHAAGDPPDLIVANPTYIGPGQPGPGHVEGIIRSAAVADYDGRWAFDTSTPAAITKTKATESRLARALPRSGQPQQPSAKPWTSPTLPAHASTTSWCSTTYAPPDTSSTQSPTAC
jgi:hypothetical protein